MLPSPASDTEQDKTRFGVRYRLKLDLIDIAAGGMARSTECLLVMARLAIRLLAFDSETVRELEVQVMHFCKVRPLAAIDSRKAGRAKGHHVLP